MERERGTTHAALPRQVVGLGAAPVEGDQEVGAAVAVGNGQLGLAHLLARGLCEGASGLALGPGRESEMDCGRTYWAGPRGSFRPCLRVERGGSVGIGASSSALSSWGFSRKAPELSLTIALSPPSSPIARAAPALCRAPSPRPVPTPTRAQLAGCGKTRRLHAPQRAKGCPATGRQATASAMRSIPCTRAMPNWIRPISGLSAVASHFNTISPGPGRLA